MYTAELPPAKLRGTFNFFPSLLTTAIFGTLVLGTINGFRYYYTSLIAVGLVALFEISMFWLATGDSYIGGSCLGNMRKGQYGSCCGLEERKVIPVKKELEEMKKSFPATKTNWRLLLKRSALIYTLMLHGQVMEYWNHSICR